MNALEIMEHHKLIRETCGYDEIKKIDPCDLPNFIQFLKIVSNYKRLNRLL